MHSYMHSSIDEMLKQAYDAHQIHNNESLGKEFSQDDVKFLNIMDTRE